VRKTWHPAALTGLMPVLSQSLGKRILLVLRFASCEAVLDEGGGAIVRFPLLALRAWMTPEDEVRLPRAPKRAVFTKNTASCCFFLANTVCMCCASHPAKQSLKRSGCPGHRSEHQAPRRSTRTITPDAVAEPPSERSVFGVV
jgi:hypothetical protein